MNHAGPMPRSVRPPFFFRAGGSRAAWQARDKRMRGYDGGVS